MGPRILDVAMTDQDYEALRKKLLETYSVRPTLLNPTVKTRVDWHCLESSCFLDHQVFEKRDKWMRHHQRFHNRMCDSDIGYPKEVEAKQFIQEYELRERARLGIARVGIAGAGGSASLMPPTATLAAGPYSRIAGALRAMPPNSAAPSSSTSGALRGASPNSAAPNSPRSGALRNSAAAGRARRGPRGPYRQRANRSIDVQEAGARRLGPNRPLANRSIDVQEAGARRREHPDPGLVNTAGALQDEPESSRTLDAAQREILMQQLNYNLQAVSQINADSVHIMEILGLPSTNCVSEIRRPAGSNRPRESPNNTGAQENPATTVATPVPLPTWVVDRRAPASTSRRARGLPAAGQSKFVAASQAPVAHSNEGPAHVFESTPYPSQAPAHSNEDPAHPSQAFALSIGGPAHSYASPPLSIERPAHPAYEGLPLSIEGPVDLALTFTTPSQPEEKEEEENPSQASDSKEVVDSDNVDQAADLSQDVNEGQVEWRLWRNVKVEP